MAITTRVPRGHEEAHFADTVFETEHETHSMLLDKDGNPMPYRPRPPMGFDLRRRHVMRAKR